jgi:hypothetical protein
MKSWPILIAVVAIQGSCFVSSLRAETLPVQLTATVSQDGVPNSAEVTNIDCYFEPTSDGYGGKWVIGTPGYNEWTWDTLNPDGGSIVMSGMLDPDPEISFSMGVVDPGAASNFSFMFVLPLSPQFPNPSVVFDSLTGTVTNAVGPNVTVTALGPPAGIPVDGDGVTELQVYTLSDDGGVTWKNVGLDAGPTQVTVTPPATSQLYGPPGGYNQGPIPTIAGGPWTHMRVDLNFRLSGGSDAFSFSGSKVLVPEPGTIVLLAFGVVGAAGLSRRRR